MAFPPCRHRGPELSAWAASCHSPRLSGDQLVTPELCASCYCRDPALTPGPPGVVLDMGGNGIGDGLLGLCAAEGLRRARPRLGITYHCSAAALPFVRLFRGWSDAALHARSHNEAPVPGAVQVNAGYSAESATPETRVARYCRNVGAPGPARPPLAEPDRLRALGAAFAGAVLLAPFSHHAEREWPLDRWLALERLLTDAGHRVVVLHHDAARCGPFRGEKLTDRPPAAVAGAVLNAALLVGNDSGMAHLAGILDTPAVALCGPTSGAKVFSAYPAVLPLDGMEGLSAERAAEASLGHLFRDALPYTLLSTDKLSGLAWAARETAALGGDLAELGVYRGGSALVLARWSAGRLLRLFDTFAGLPHDDHGGGLHSRGEFACDEVEVRAVLAGHRVEVRRGTFPATAAGLEDARYSCVHVDADLYEATRDAIAYFWPRLLPGGVMMFDDVDWGHTPGVRRALEEAGLYAGLRRTALYQAAARKPG